MIAFAFLIFAYISLWIRKDPKIWGTFIVLSWLFGLMSGVLQPLGLIILILSSSLWFIYAKAPSFSKRVLLFFSLIVLGFTYIFHLLPGFSPLLFSGKFVLGLETPSFFFFPLALFVPLARTKQDWKEVLQKGIPLSFLGIGLIALIATGAKVVHIHPKWPSFATVRYASNFFLTAMPEEAFFRGFIQQRLMQFFKKSRRSSLFAFLLSTLLFTVAHVYWSPNLATLAFVFVAGLLYGGVYWATQRIEASILCHFLLNFVHMTFFSYHAM